ncbi:MAG: hypothetical protein LW636_12650 [Planctomycetaceae bacterium]|nr:hypothetical protein [Planctomycetaceae bacterium]
MNDWIRMLIVIVASIAMGAAPCALGAEAPRQSAADAGDEITVKAKGEGVDPAEAKNDATRAALRQAVGSFVDVKTVTDGDRIVTDRILSATGALVIGSKVISGPKRRGDGLYEVECEVRIRKRNLVGSLTEAGFTITGSIDGDAARRVSSINFKNAKEAQALLADRLDNLWTKLFIGRILDDKGVPLGENELPKVVDRGDGTVVVCANVQIYFHLEAYYTKFVPEMKDILEALAVGKGEWTVNRATWKGKGKAPRSRFGGVPVYANGTEPGTQSLSELPSRATLWLSDGRDESGLNEHFVGFELPPEIAEPVVKFGSRYRPYQASFGFRVELLDDSGRVVASEARAALGGLFLGVTTTDTEPQVSRDLTVPLEEVAFGVPEDPVGGRCDAWEVRVELVLPAADLANVKGYRITPFEGKAKE